jgi:hypothetical protein
MDLIFAGLHQLCAPFLDRIEWLLDQQAHVPAQLVPVEEGPAVAQQPGRVVDARVGIDTLPDPAQSSPAERRKSYGSLIVPSADVQRNATDRHPVP